MGFLHLIFGLFSKESELLGSPTVFFLFGHQMDENMIHSFSDWADEDVFLMKAGFSIFWDAATSNVKQILRRRGDEEGDVFVSF